MRRPAVNARVLVWGAIAAWAAGFAVLSVMRELAFHTGRFDLGNMVQVVWATAHGHPLQMTDLNGDQISRLAAHVDPILALFAPLWWIWPAASMLLVVQAVAVALGALPVYWLARKHIGADRAAVALALVYLSYPATGFLVLNEFHPVALATPLLLFAFWYLDEERLLRFAVYAAAASLCKEEISLVVAGFGIWFAVTRHRRMGVGIAVLGMAWAALALGVIIPHFNHGAASNFYTRYSEVGGSPRAILRTAVTHPLRLLAAAFGARSLHYLGRLLIPLGLVCFASPLVLLALLPELGVNLLSAIPAQTSIHFHYVAGEIPPLMIASVFGVARLARRWPGSRETIAVAVLVLTLAANYRLGPIPIWHSFSTGKITQHDRIAARALRLIPSGAVVSASNSLGAHLSARRRILSFPYLQDATWIAADETVPAYADQTAPVPTAVELASLRANPAWKLVFEQDGILVFRRVLPP